MSKRFDRIYEQALAPLVAELAQRRRAALLKLCGIWVVLAVGAAWLAPRQDMLFWGYLVVAAVLAPSAYVYFRDDYRERYKRQVNTRLVEALLPGLTYRPDRGLDASEFTQSGLYDEWFNRFSAEDLVTGPLNGREIAFSEVSVRHHERNYRNGKSYTQTKTVFHGLLVRAALSTRIDGHVMVVQDVAERLLGGLGVGLQKHNPTRPPLVHFEDAEFERRFAVYATDEDAARALLTPHWRSVLVELDKVVTGIRVAFRGSWLYVTIPVLGNAFEPALMLPTGGRAEVEAIARQFERVVGVIKALDLTGPDAERLEA